MKLYLWWENGVGEKGGEERTRKLLKMGKEVGDSILKNNFLQNNLRNPPHDGGGMCIGMPPVGVMWFAGGCLGTQRQPPAHVQLVFFKHY